VTNLEMRKVIETRSNQIEISSKIKGYQILNPIDKGGFAEVVEVRDE
jgi:hypothetical protein